MAHRSGSNEPLTVSQFLMGAALFEGFLLMVAFAAGAVSHTSPTDHLSWSAEDFGLGLLAAVPMLAVLGLCFLIPFPGLQWIRTFLRDTIGPYLHSCNILDLFLLALLAGVCEEVLFRGFLYFWIRDWNLMLAVVVSNVLFGAAHSITPVYAILAGFLGLYLTSLLTADASPNLLIPITAHTFYDFIGFLVVVSDYRRHHREIQV